MRAITIVATLSCLLPTLTVSAAGPPVDPGSQGRGRTFSNPRVERALQERGASALMRSVPPADRRIGAEFGTGRLGTRTQLGDDLRPDNRLGRDGQRLSGQNRDHRPLDSGSTEGLPDDKGQETAGRHHGGTHISRPGRPVDLNARLLAQRLANIDHLRDVALENDNLELLNRADQLEELARRQFLMRTEGTKLDWGQQQRELRQPAAEPDQHGSVPPSLDDQPSDELDSDGSDPIEPDSK